MKAKATIPKESKLPERPLAIVDPPEVLPEISQAEIVAFSRALQIFQLARADFEQRRAAVTMKLLHLCACEKGDYFAFLDDAGNLIVEDCTSLEPITNRPVVDRSSVPSGGAA
jgi:hypothetical protein